MADSRDFSLAEAATSAACTRFLLHSALDATELLHRYQQLMGAVARRQVSPALVGQHIARAVHSTTPADDLQRAVRAFVESFTRVCFVTNAAVDTDDVASRSDELDAGVDASVIMRHQRALHSFTAQVAALAEPTVSAGARRRALTRSEYSSANQLISHAATQWFTVLSAITGAQSRALLPALLASLREAQPVGYDGHVLELSGSVPSRVSTALTIDNERNAATSVRCTATDVRRADGVGPAFVPPVTITPEVTQLAAKQSGTIEVAVHLDAQLFADRTSYVGAVQVSHADGTTVDIPLRITTGESRV